MFHLTRFAGLGSSVLLLLESSLSFSVIAIMIPDCVVMYDGCCDCVICVFGVIGVEDGASSVEDSEIVMEGETLTSSECLKKLDTKKGQFLNKKVNIIF